MELSRFFPSMRVVVLSLVSAATVYVLLFGQFSESTISSKPLPREVLITDKVPGQFSGSTISSKPLPREVLITNKVPGQFSESTISSKPLPRAVLLTDKGKTKTSLPKESTSTKTLKQKDVKRYPDYCNDTLLQPQNVNMKRISSYQFPGIEEYIKELFPTDMSPVIPDVPLFITGFSYNHFKEGLALIDNFEKNIKVRYPEFKLHVYDIGITAEQKTEVKLACNCTVETFPLEKFPEHDRIMKGYGWKPLVIQFAARKYRFVIWMDACIRFSKSNIDGLLTKIKTHGIVTGIASRPIAEMTLKETFDFLNEQPCLYSGIPEIAANFVAIRETDMVRDYIMKPWVSCALIRGCLVSTEDVYQVIPCKLPAGKNNKCHRFDQSVLGILIHRLNHAKYLDNVVNSGQYFSCCRGCV